MLHSNRVKTVPWRLRSCRHRLPEVATCARSRHTPKRVGGMRWSRPDVARSSLAPWRRLTGRSRCGPCATLSTFHSSTSCYKRVGVKALQLTPPWRATEQWLSRRDISGLRRRDRWMSERTLERFVQEEHSACTHDSSSTTQTASPSFSSRIREIAELAPSFFADILRNPQATPESVLFLFL